MAAAVGVPVREVAEVGLAVSGFRTADADAEEEEGSALVGVPVDDFEEGVDGGRTEPLLLDLEGCEPPLVPPLFADCALAALPLAPAPAPPTSLSRSLR